jgi:hypothetical protein
VIESASSTPWISKATVTNGEHAAYLTGTAATQTRTRLGTAPNRVTQTATQFDDYGMATQTDDYGDMSIAADNRCTRYTYNRNPDLGILDKIARTEVVAVKCATEPDRRTDVISDTRLYYDKATTLDTAPTRGLVTRTSVWPPTTAPPPPTRPSPRAATTPWAA